jgi:hypothetical protein
MRAVAIKGLRICAVLAVQQSHWGALRDYLTNGNLPRASKAAQKILAELHNETKKHFDSHLAACFARSDSLATLESSEQKPISKFLRDLERSQDWQKRISVEERGAAIERSQRYVDAVEFYESAMTTSAGSGQNRFAITRWVKSKQRLEIFYRGEKQYRKADDIKEEWEQVTKTDNVEASELAVEYPVLDTLPELLARELGRSDLTQTGKIETKKVEPETSVQPIVGPLLEILPSPGSDLMPANSHIPKPDVDMMFDKIKLKFSHENKRINLEHQITSKTSTIRLSPARCTSEDVLWKPSEADGAVYRCVEWGLQVDASELETKHLIVLRFEEADAVVSVDTR